MSEASEVSSEKKLSRVQTSITRQCAGSEGRKKPTESPQTPRGSPANATVPVCAREKSSRSSRALVLEPPAKRATTSGKVKSWSWPMKCMSHPRGSENALTKNRRMSTFSTHTAWLPKRSSATMRCTAQPEIRNSSRRRASSSARLLRRAMSACSPRVYVPSSAARLR